ncbi:MAG: DUF4893 domain-containing protein [Sphingomicrobium sp.]
MRQSVLIATLLAALAACGPRPTVGIVRSPMMPRATPAWREIATTADRERLRDWRKAFTAAVAAARASGHGDELAREGRLLDPDGALADPAIPDGRYRCRVTKLGARSEGMLDFIAYPAFTCVIGMDGSLQRIDKLTGSQRYVGLIFPADGMRQMFLGTLVLGDENRAMQYGQDETRNIAGFIERVGERQWRLVMPSPHFESLTDVMELLPAP